MPIRPATYRDISTVSTIFARAFYDDGLFKVLLPCRGEYYEDYVRAWRHKITEHYWGYNTKYLVSYTIVDGKEVVTGGAEYLREGDGWEELWGIWGWWDPRLLIRPLLSLYHKLHRQIFPNRASTRPTPTNPILTYWTWETASFPFIAHFLIPPSVVPHTTVSALPPTTSDPPPPPSPPTNTNPHAPYWDLCVLGTDPAHQGNGHGRALATWGLDRAREENIPAVVVAAYEKEDFYLKTGYVNLVGWCTGGKGNPLMAMGVRGGAVCWSPWPWVDGAKVEKREGVQVIVEEKGGELTAELRDVAEV